MKSLSVSTVNKYVNENIDTFHQSRIARIQSVKLNDVLKRKNPYLFRAKNILNAGRLVESILDAFLSSSEEELFGVFLEGLAVFIAGQTMGGRKSSTKGIDLEFERNGINNIVAIKSGQNWGNSSQYAALRANFKNAIKVLKQNKEISSVQPVLGMCYGRMRTVDTGEYLKIAGQSFWHYISGNANLYTEIIEPIGFQAKQHNDKYIEEKSAVINMFTTEFAAQFCIKGRINWDALVAFNSSNLKAS